MALCVGLAGISALAVAGIAAPAAAQRPGDHPRAFGYELGEERRYVLEPEKSLRAGEGAWWSIVLEEINGEGDDENVVFALEHERRELIRDLFGGDVGRMQFVHVSGRLTVNRFGFPERLVFNEQHDLSGETGSRSDLRTTLFAFDGERLVKQVRINGREWSFNIAIANQRDLDLQTPAGMWAFVPSALRCLGSPGVPGLPARCAGGDPAFANPGLLNLVLPVLWEEQVNKKQFLFFMPDGVGTAPAGTMDINRWVSLERDNLRNYSRYFDQVDLEVKDFVPGVEIGPRHVDAWRVDAGGEMREFYIDADGKVLKLEIDPHPITFGPRWIRLLFPSEY